MHKIPIFRQPEGSVICGPVCLKMLLHHHGIKMPVNEIVKNIKMHKKGTSPGELGKFLLKQGFDVTIANMDVTLFPSKLKNKNINSQVLSLKRKLDSLDSASKRMAKGLISFVESGGNVVMKVTTARDIKNLLSKGNPLIFRIERSSLYKVDELGDHGHYVLPVKINGDKITINDPQEEYGGIKTYRIEDLLFSLYSRRGYVISVDS